MNFVSGIRVIGIGKSADDDFADDGRNNGHTLGKPESVTDPSAMVGGGFLLPIDDDLHGLQGGFGLYTGLIDIVITQVSADRFRRRFHSGRIVSEE